LIIDLLSQESKLRLLFQRHVDEFVCCCIYSTLHPNDAKITDFSMLKVLQQNKMVTISKKKKNNFLNK